MDNSAMNQEYKRFLVRARNRRQRAFNLWHRGLSFAEIGRKLGISRQRARMLVNTYDARGWIQYGKAGTPCAKPSCEGA